ncbi:MAG: transposase [Bacilli bacterium]
MDNENIEKIKKRELNSGYIVAHAVTCMVNVNKNNVTTKKEIYYIIGIDILGKRRLLTYGIDNDDSRYWINKLEDIKVRGVKRIFFTNIKDNSKFSKAFKIVFQDTQLIPSVNEVVIGLQKFFSDSYTQTVYNDLAKLYIQNDYIKFEYEKSLFFEKYCDNKVVSLLVKPSIDAIDKVYDYPLNIRKMLFTYYYIRDFYKEIRKKHKHYGIISDINEFTKELIPYIQKIEKSMWCSKKELLDIIDSLHELYGDEVVELMSEAKR